jgi:ribose-phosphate pyrophosphokinase
MTVLSMAPLLAGLIHAVEENSSLSEVLAHAFDD